MFSLTGIQAKIAEYALCLILCFVAYNWVGDRAVSQYKTEAAIAQAKADQAQQAKYNKIAEEYENLKLTRASNAITIKKEVERIIHNQPIVYSTNCISDDGMQLANKALNPASASTSKFVGAVPPSE